MPDLPGWRRKPMPQIPEDQGFTAVPEWVCNILSKAVERKGREIKMPAYAAYGVDYLGLIDPLARTLEAYAREGRSRR